MEGLQSKMKGFLMENGRILIENERILIEHDRILKLKIAIIGGGASGIVTA